ncbi:MAG: GTPase ObgE [Dehalococcoidia bacterium]
MIDIVEIVVKAGNGGDGVVSFRREKFVPFGGPDGGDGGNGGSVWINVDLRRRSLDNFKQKRQFRARDGVHGSGRKKHGRKGEELDLSVPPGTLIYRVEDSRRLPVADMREEGQRVEVARGGRGGWGNARYATPTNQAPVIARTGVEGEERTLVLELKLIADVGIIGYPSVGKSTLLAAATAARPQIAAYPFTTREPLLGVVEVGFEQFVLAEIPGLIEGAHKGRGLGHEFLRHIERTRLLIHVLDGTGEDLLEDMRKVNEELALYQPALTRKPQIVAVNKMDIPEARARCRHLPPELASLTPHPFLISAATGEGVGELMAHAARMVQSLQGEDDEEGPLVVFRPRPQRGKRSKEVSSG